MLIARAGNIEVAPADIVNGLVINQECTIRVLNSAVGGENGVVGLNDSGRDPGSGVYGELKLAFLAVLSRQTFQQESTETRAGTTAKRVEDQETLKRIAVVYRFYVSILKKKKKKRLGKEGKGIGLLPTTRRIRSKVLSTISLPMV